MVVYENYNFKKSSYRKFNIKAFQGKSNDDYFMLKQVLERRFNFSEEWKKELPNLIIIDGGKGQLNVAQKILTEKQISNIDLISIAKGKRRNSGDETIYSGKIGKVLFLNSEEKETHQQLISIGAKDRAVFVWNVEHH